jgi:phosphoribosylformylglycinamidine cyclo-ligase
VFNCWIGMVAVVAAADAEAATAMLREAGETVSAIGTIEPADGPASVQFAAPPGFPG